MNTVNLLPSSTILRILLVYKLVQVLQLTARSNHVRAAFPLSIEQVSNG